MCSASRDFYRRFNSELKKLGFNEEITFTSKITFEYVSDNKISLLLPSDAAVKNMQEDECAFESYAIAFIALYRKLGKEMTVRLDIDENYASKIVKYTSIGHYNRFLYRLKRFSEQFGRYIELSENMEEVLNKICFAGYDGDEYAGWEHKTFTEFEESSKVLSFPANEAGGSCPDKNKPPEEYSETQIEKYFFENPEEISERVKKETGSAMSKLNRQLPVGVYVDEAKEKNTVFMGHKAAIDLWSISENKEEFNVFELKKVGAKPIGIISELFFYANLMKDVYCENKNYKRAAAPERVKSDRGVSSLSGLEGRMKKVNAFFLINTLDPLIIDETITLMNEGHEKIHYGVIRYNKELHIE